MSTTAAEPLAEPTLSFVCGCPRSGTTALWRLLVSHPSVAMGLERFSNKMFGTFSITRDLFQRDRFFDCRPDDTFYDDLLAFDERYAALEERFDSTTLRGDKLPKLYRNYPALIESIPDARVVCIVRNVIDVAQSYDRRAQNLDDHTWRPTQDHKAAVLDWNESIATTLAFHEQHPDNLMVIEYEHFFGTEGRLHPLLSFLGLEMNQEVATMYRAMVLQNAELEQQRPDALPSRAKQHVLLNADSIGYRRLLELCVR